MRTRRKAGFAREIQERRNGGAKDIGVKDTAAMALAGEREGEIHYFEETLELDRSTNAKVEGHKFSPAMVDFPTPPFADDTTITFRTSWMLRFSGKPRWRRGRVGGAPDRGKPWQRMSAMELLRNFEQLPEDSHAVKAVG